MVNTDLTAHVEIERKSQVTSIPKKFNTVPYLPQKVGVFPKPRSHISQIRRKCTIHARKTIISNNDPRTSDLVLAIYSNDASFLKYFLFMIAGDIVENSEAAVEQ